MKKHILLTVIFLSLLFGFSVSFASETSDSLRLRIEQSQGLDKINAKLDLSFYLRRTEIPEATALAQESLNEIIVNYTDNEELKTRAMYYLALTNFYDHEYLSALDLLYQTVMMAQQQKDDFLLADLYFFIGASHYFFYGDNSQAINYYNQSIHYGLISGNYKIMGAVYSSLSTIFRVSGSYEKSLEFIYRSRENYAKANYEEGIAWVDYVMGSLYSTVGLYREALIAFKRATDIYRKQSLIDENMTGVAICLDQLCVVNTELNKLSLAKKYNEEALEYYISGNSTYGISNALKYRATIERKLGNYNTAKTLLDSSLTMKKAIKDNIGFSSIYTLYGALFIENKEYERALDSLDLGFYYATKNNQMKNKVELDNFIALAYEKLGKYEQAYLHKAREIAVADSIFNSKTTRNMLQLEALYEIESKESEIHKLENEKLITEISLSKQKQLQLYLYFIIGLSFIVILLFVYFLMAKTRINKELLESKALVEQSNAEKDKFYSILAHDLRTPFNGLLGLTKILKEKHLNMSEDERDTIIQSLYRTSNNNYSLLNNLLEWSRNQRGLSKIKPEPFLLNELISDICTLLRVSAKEKGVNIEFEDKPFDVAADKNMIHTVLRNLISNAIKYCHDGDKIKVSVEKDNKSTVVSVSDTGIGMNHHDLNRLFNINDTYQIDGTAGEKGTGLGLIICKDFIDQHGGRIWVESEPGKGSTFKFTLPDNH